MTILRIELMSDGIDVTNRIIDFITKLERNHEVRCVRIEQELPQFVDIYTHSESDTNPDSESTETD